MGKIGRNMKKLEIYRKKLMMKIIIEYHFAGIPKGRNLIGYFFLKTLNLYCIYYLDSRSLWAEVSSMYQGVCGKLIGANGDGMTTT
jgi:hypothetical protein